MNGSEFAVSLSLGQSKGRNPNTMKSPHFFALLLASLLLGGCATVDSRISRNQVEFNTWPAAVQAKIRTGNVDLGFTREQVGVALGEPDKVYSRKTIDKEQEIWAYFDNRPQFAIGLGVGTGLHSGAYTGTMGGVVRDRQRDRLDESTRVVFEAGKVVALEARTKS